MVNLKSLLFAFTVMLSSCSNPDGQDTRAEANRAAVGKASSVEKNWPTTGGPFSETHYSRSDQINRSNVKSLGFAWEYSTGTWRGLEATPVVVDGKMYTTGNWGKVYALNARDGSEIWRFDPEVDGQVAGDACCDVVNRGVAVWDGKVYVAALDGVLYALSERDGSIVWKVDTVENRGQRRYTSTGAPRITGDVVVIGNAGAEFNARGYFSGYDLATGKLRWRFYTVPGRPDAPYENPELELAARTWDANSRWEVGGGGTVWDGMAYDPDLDLLYVGTGNGALYPQSERSPDGGDNLFLSSILAIRPSTGELAWHYQTTPGDSWDFTATQNIILADLDIDGKSRKVLLQAPKNGFFYVIDRVTGKLLSAEPYAPVNWASHVDIETGRPVLTEQANYFSEPKVIYPTTKGAHGWRPMAFSEKTDLVYIPVYEEAGLSINLFGSRFKYDPDRLNTGALSLPLNPAAVDFYRPILPMSPDKLKEIIRSSDAPRQRAVLRAWDPVSQKVRWEREMPFFRNGGGVLATAGGLVFHAAASGHLEVFDDQTGELLHTIKTGTGLMAAPASYTIDGEQYIVVMAGLGGGGFFDFPKESGAYHYGNAGRVLAFKIGGGAVPLPPQVTHPSIPEPPRRPSDRAQLLKGQKLYLWNCVMCHRNAGPGLLPDLRYLGKDKHKLFDMIVREGLLVGNGMPKFGEKLSKEKTDAIQAFLIESSWREFEKQGRSDKPLDISTH